MLDERNLLKECTRCHEIKAFSEFYPRPDGRPCSHCKICHHKLCSDHNKQRRKEDPVFRDSMNEYERVWKCRKALKQHHEDLKDDKDRLSTEFLAGLLGISCKRVEHKNAQEKEEITKRAEDK